ncbi:hypothetical protein [Nostoc sp. DSM 114159]
MVIFYLVIVTEHKSGKDIARRSPVYLTELSERSLEGWYFLLGEGGKTSFGCDRSTACGANSTIP